MSIKTLLFGLFLYVCLVWVGVAYWESGVNTGLFWTAIGLIALLGYLILARIAGWWQLRRARASARPPAIAARPIAAVVHEDDAALAALLEEANAALAKAPDYRPERGRVPICELPVYLLIGPEGSGKTSTFVNSSLEPQLLAGQVTGSAPVVPTRLCNVWLAGKAVFVELAGRTFSGDLGRWKELLGVLRGKPKIPLWRRLWGMPEQQLTLRAVMGFCDVKEFTGASADPQRLERQAREWQERLRAIAEVFGAEFPVYQVITKCDAIPFFPEFFRRLPEMEAGQILGCTLSLNRGDTLRRGEVFAEAEGKRLTASFRSLYHRLASRRLIHLAHEPDPAKRPAVYEFPRELKRIRSPLVQFLTDTFRPNALQPGPLLRGYYLTGTRHVEVAGLDPGVTRSDWNAGGSLEATRLFRTSEATQMFRSTDEFKSPSRRLAQRWTFVADLFRELLPSEPPRRQQPREDLRLRRVREYAFTGVVAVCAVFCLVFLGSWYGNRELLHRVEAAGVSKPAYSKPPSLTDFQALDKLRAEVEGLRRDPILSLHWGLYTGDRLLAPARKAYFQRFRSMLLDELNAGMVSTLATVSETADRYDAIYRILRTHLTISGNGCGLDADQVSTTLRDEERNRFADVSPDWRRAAEKHIAFYASELPYGNPSPVALNAIARDHARQYLAKGNSDDAAYLAILGSAEKSVAKPRRLVDWAPDYAKVMTGPNEVSAAFSPDGWTFVATESKNSKGTALDSCVTGTQSVAIGDSQAIQQRYLREYIDRWSAYVSGFSVTRFGSAEDAARRLNILVDNNKPPLLGLLAMTARQTVFPASAPGAIEQGVGRIGKEIQKRFGGTVPQPAEPAKSELLTPASVTNAFQPVHLVTPPESPTLVSEKNTPYVEALRQLRSSLQDLAQSGSPEAANLARENSRKAFEAAQKLADGFRQVDAAGLNATVKRLLEEPIKEADRWIPRPEKPGKEIEAGLAALSPSLPRMLAKYPFNRGAASVDVTLQEFDAAFAPATGSIWAFSKLLGTSATKERSQWKAGDPAAKPQVTPELLKFLNQAERITGAFYPGGATSARLDYSLLPKPDPAGRTLRLEIDSQSNTWTSTIRGTFVWPSATAEKGGRLRLLFPGGSSSSIASFGGVWGIFRIMDSGDFEQPDSPTIVWKYSGLGRTEPIDPPVQMDIVGLAPAAAGVFHRRFFEGFTVPRKAAQ